MAGDAAMTVQPPPRAAKLSRRRLLLGSTGLLASGVLGTGAVIVTNDIEPGSTAIRRTLGFTGTAGTVPAVPGAPMRVFTPTSARRGRTVEMAVITPELAGSAQFPVVLGLHGRGGTARSWADLGLPEFMTAGQIPLTVVTVDGGDNYWHPVRGDDPLAMLLDELPAWLYEHGLPEPVAVLGYSMGAFGALLYARRRAELGRPVAAAAAMSGAWFRSWPEADRRNCFANEDDWRSCEPLQHLTELGALPLAVWCGTEDPFIDAARELGSRRPATLLHVDRGAHND